MQYSTIFTDEGTKVGGAVGAAEKTTDGERGWEARGRERRRGGEGRKGRDLDFYHGSILVLRQRLPSLTSSQSSSLRSFSVSRALALFLPLSRRKLLDNCYLHFYPIEENI